MLSVLFLSQRSLVTMLSAKQLLDQWLYTSGPLVQGRDFHNSFTRTPGRIQTVSRRSKLRSCTALLGEQPNPWNHLQYQDAIIQHRGAKPLRR